VQYNIKNLSPGEAGTDQTVKAINDLIDQDLRRPFLRIAAIQILDRSGAGLSNYDRAAAFFEWINDNVRFVPDPEEIETVQSPEATLKIRAGDCDDMAGLMAGLCAAVGIPYRFKVIGNNRKRLSHIYAEIKNAGRWVPADPTKNFAFGEAPPDLNAIKYYNEKGDSMLGQYQLTKARAATIIKREIFRALTANWNGGLIGRADLQGYLKTIDSGNFPAKSPFLQNVSREAIKSFLDYVDRAGLEEHKPAGMSGVGLSGFLSDVWGAVKKGSKDVYDFMTGAQETLETRPLINLPEGIVRPEVGPEAASGAAKSAVNELLKSPVLLIGLGLLAYKVLK
jgi:hypothetical protein